MFFGCRESGEKNGIKSIIAVLWLLYHKAGKNKGTNCKSAARRPLLRFASGYVKIRGESKRDVIAIEAYSVLMSVYAKEKPENLRQSLESMFAQDPVTDDFVLVCDGPLTGELDRVIAEYEAAYPASFRPLRFAENRGLGPSLRDGLLACRNDLVARMDSDDISLPDRCRKQLALFEARPELKICGGAIAEFMGSPENTLSVRSLPGSGELAAYARLRNPFNHMTVMFRKSAVLAAGSYRDAPLFEDYDLWLRMLGQGWVGDNLPDILVLARVDGMHSRRGGAAYLKKAAAFRRQMLRNGYCSGFEYVYALSACAAVYLMPNRLRQWIYRRFLREETGQGA